jgi:hypothetical protein
MTDIQPLQVHDHLFLPGGIAIASQRRRPPVLLDALAPTVSEYLVIDVRIPADASATARIADADAAPFLPPLPLARGGDAGFLAIPAASILAGALETARAWSVRFPGSPQPPMGPIELFDDGAAAARAIRLRSDARIYCVFDVLGASLWTRHGQWWTARPQRLAGAALTLPVGSVVDAATAATLRGRAARTDPAA